MDAPLLLKISKEKLEEARYDSLNIAELEFNAGVLPITVKRPLPRKVESELKREKEVEKKIEPKELIKVVAQLPVQEVRKIVDKDGTIYNLITIEEALTEVLNQE